MANKTIWDAFKNVPPVSPSALTVGASGSGGAGASYTMATAGYVNNNVNLTGTVNVQGANPDIVIGDKSMVKWMQKVEERLAILEPKQELLDKYESLREAYEHYKTLEALLHDELQSKQT